MNETLFEYLEHRDNEPISLVALGESCKSQNKNTQRRFFDNSVLETVVSGQGILEVNGKTYELTGGDVIILRKGTNYSCHPVDGGTLQRAFIVLSGEFSEILIDAYLPDNGCIYHNCNTQGLFKDAIDAARKYPNDYQSVLTEVICIFMRMLVELSTHRVSPQTELAENVHDYLNSHIDKPFSLDMLCDKLGYSKNHIINLFRNEYGKTPYQYYTDMRLETVKMFLKNTNLTLSEISKRMSFSNRQYFSSWFKSLCGMSLSEYRIQIRKEKQ